MDVSIIIVNYNTKDLTRNCLRSVYENTRGLDFEVFIVDNASSDGSCEMVRNEFPDVILIKNSINAGFGPANNMAILQSRAKYVFLLNSDTVLLNNAVKIFFDYCESHQEPRLGAVGGYLLNTDGKIIHSYRHFDTIPVILKDQLESLIKDRLFGIERWNRIIRKKPLPENRIADEIDVDYVTGADMFVPAAALSLVGLFDEAFFMYSEESDLQKRMESGGFARRIIKGPKIIHLEGKSLSMSLGKRAMIYTGKFRYLRKHHHRCVIKAGKVAFLLLELPMLVFMKGAWADKKNYLRAWSKF